MRSAVSSPNPSNAPLAGAIPDGPFHLHMGLRRGSAQEFFAETADHDAILQERSALIDAFPQRHIALSTDGEEVLREFFAVMDLSIEDEAPIESMTRIGRILEPDVLLLRREGGGPLRLVGGALCFPSSWSLEEKMGHTLEAIHQPVPGLNDQIGRPIDTFLAGMKPGSAWLRSNWGLSRFPDRNQHTALGLAELSSDAAATDAWVRAEHQLLIPLPDTNSIAFGIRLGIQRLDEAAADPQLRAALAKQLETMPPGMAAYKRIEEVRAALASWLQARG